MTKARSPSEAVDAEDFLYHLYRGSEALSEGRLDLAKDSLETALKMQPRDPSAQDLLGKLYFKLGVYPRAIELYQEIVRQYPDSLPPRINLALAFLKTAQLREAVGHLLPVIERDPTHGRAWGYLGLCWSRLGEYAKAREAFLRAGHEGMARKMEESLEAQYGGGSLPFLPSHAAPPGDANTRADQDEIDTAALEPGAVQVAEDTPSAPGRWVAREPGELLNDGRVGPSTLSSWATAKAFVPVGRTLECVDDMLVAYEGCAVRCEANTFGVGFSKGPAVRGRDAEPFDGASPMHWVADGWCAIPRPPGAERTLVALRDEALLVIERCMLGFDGGLHLELVTIAGALRAASFVGRGAIAIQVDGAVRVLRVQREEAVVAQDLVVAWSPGVSVELREGAAVFAGDGVVAVRVAGARSSATGGSQ
jgi:hypothetical protein